MNITSLSSIKEEREDVRRKAYIRLKRARVRYLGGHVYRAIKGQYSCDRCVFPINYLEQYRLDRYVRDHYDKDGKKIWTRFWYERSHWPQCYGPSDEEDRKIREQIERDREAERAGEYRNSA